ncbi:hypothetical protein ACFL6C_09205 [Myxococcota bacterium]
MMYVTAGLTTIAAIHPATAYTIRISRRQSLRPAFWETVLTAILN